MNNHDWKIVAGVVLAIAAIIGIAAAVVVPKERRADRLHATLPSVHVGMSEAELVKLAGPPDEITPCQQRTESCKVIYHYDVPLAIAGEEWWIRIDNQGRVAHKKFFASQ